MNIDDELNKIIFKYHLDRCYPHYRNMYKAENFLRGEIDTVIQCCERVIFLGDDEAEIAFVRNMARGYMDIHFQLYKHNETAALEDVDWKQYNKVYLLSYYGAEYIERWLREQHISYEWIYDLFAREEIVLQSSFLFLVKENLMPMIDRNIYNHNSKTGSIQCELYCQQSKYYFTNDLKVKRIALEKCLFLALYMKNFVLAKEYITLLKKEDGQYQYVWEAIQELLYSIRKELRNRKTEDIIVYWLDAIPYGGENDMPYLQSIMKKSIVFENAFTYMPNTNPVLRALFLGKKDVDDRAYRIETITRENSFLIQFLEEENYDIKIISGYFNTHFPFQYQPDRFIFGGFEAASAKLWDMVANMLRQQKKTLWIVHAMDAHSPELNAKMNDDNYKNSRMKYKLAKRELDGQLAFYDSLMSEQVYKIYMSDHGREAMYRYHVLFNVYHRRWQPKRIEGLFSLLDFGIVLKQIILDREIQESAFIREYVEIGNCDRYNRHDIKAIFQNKAPLDLHLFGYKGVIDKNYIYIRYRTGKEWFHRRKEALLCEPLLFYDGRNDICEPERLPEYRELAGEYPEDIMNDDRFRFARYLCTLYENILKHNNMSERVEIINQMLQDYPNGSVAIRMGGVLSSKLYYILSDRNRKKIWGFIDSDAECLCSKLGMPVIAPEKTAELNERGVKAILLSSYNNLDMLRKEAEVRPEGIDILDMYEAFDKQGIRCQEDFYKMRGTDEDYDIGFPFDEVKK